MTVEFRHDEAEFIPRCRKRNSPGEYNVGEGGLRGLCLSKMSQLECWLGDGMSKLHPIAPLG